MGGGLLWCEVLMRGVGEIWINLRGGEWESSMPPVQKRLLRAAILVWDLAEVGAKRGRAKTNARKKSGGEEKGGKKRRGALFSVVRSRVDCLFYPRALVLLFYRFYFWLFLIFPLPKGFPITPPPFYFFLRLCPRLCSPCFFAPARFFRFYASKSTLGKWRI